MKERWKGWRALTLVALVVVMVGNVMGCGVFKSAPKDQVNLLAGDAGALCMVIPLQAPQHVAAARDALQCAKAVFTAEQIDTQAIVNCTERAGVPQKYQSLVALALQRAKVHLGQTGPIVPADSDAGLALRDFFDTCEIALS